MDLAGQVSVGLLKYNINMKNISSFVPQRQFRPHLAYMWSLGLGHMPANELQYHSVPFANTHAWLPRAR